MDSCKLAAGRLGEANIIFTSDNKFFLCSCDNDIVLYSVLTGQQTRVLSSHTDKVSILALNPVNNLQLYSASLDGTIKLWDFNDNVCLKTWPLAFPITHAIFPSATPESVYLTIKHQNAVKVVSFSLKTSNSSTVAKIPVSDCLGLELSPDGNWLAFASSITIYAYCIASKTLKSMKHQEKISYMAVHPEEGFIALGGKTGKITIWYAFNDSLEFEAVTSFHWHAHKVKAIAFASIGSYMLSGGEEGVLVLWQTQTRHKDFLPRLGSDIIQIVVSHCQTLFALVFQDNSIRIVSAVNLSIKQTIMGLKYATVNHKLYPLNTGLVVEPRHSNIVLNGVSGTLQFYNPLANKHVLELEVAPRNRISRRSDAELVHSQVAFVAFSADGCWMVTIDERDDGEFTREAYLKFWKFEQKGGGNPGVWSVNTRIDLPHEAKITGLTVTGGFNGKKLFAATCSLDSKFKIWELNSVKDECYWTCASLGTYKKLPALAAQFSPDGSVLAVSFGQVVTLWQTSKCALYKVLAYASPKNQIEQLVFTNLNHLIARSKNRIFVWDLCTCRISYTIKCHDTTGISVDPTPSGDNFLVASRNLLQVYSPACIEPVLSHHVQGKIIASCFYHKGSSYQILYMNKKYELIGVKSADSLESNDIDGRYNPGKKLKVYVFGYLCSDEGSGKLFQKVFKAKRSRVEIGTILGYPFKCFNIALDAIITIPGFNPAEKGRGAWELMIAIAQYMIAEISNLLMINIFSLHYQHIQYNEQEMFVYILRAERISKLIYRRIYCEIPTKSPSKI